MQKLQRRTVARIVRDTREASLDRLMPLDEALALWDQGKLVRLDMGSAYPYAFQEVVR